MSEDGISYEMTAERENIINAVSGAFAEISNNSVANLHPSGHETNNITIGQATFESNGNKYTLIYKMIALSHGKYPMITVELFNAPSQEAVTTNDKLASRSFSINEKGGTEVEITSKINTKGRVASHGFGAALGLISNDVINDIISKRLVDQLGGKKVIGVIIDNAAPDSNDLQNRARNGWSSWLAKKLGYELSNKPGGFQPRWTKSYQ